MKGEYIMKDWEIANEKIMKEMRTVPTFMIKGYQIY